MTKHQELRRLTLLALLTALAVTLRIVKLVPIPNFQPVTDIIMIVTLELGFAFGLSLAALTMIVSNIVLGFGLWTIPQILAYLVCVITVIIVKKVTPLEKYFLLQVLLAAFLGFEYGFVVSFGMAIYGGLAAFISYWIAGLSFDAYHAAGNFAFYLVLYKPITIALERYRRRSNDAQNLY